MNEKEESVRIGKRMKNLHSNQMPPSLYLLDKGLYVKTSQM